MSYLRVPQDSYPPLIYDYRRSYLGYGTLYPPPPPSPPPGYDEYPPPLQQGYPPPQYHHQPIQGTYQGYFNDAYPPPQPYPPTSVYHCDHYNYHDDDCFSFVRGCLAALCCCCMLEECGF